MIKWLEWLFRKKIDNRQVKFSEAFDLIVERMESDWKFLEEFRSHYENLNESTVRDMIEFEKRTIEQYRKFPKRSGR